MNRYFLFLIFLLSAPSGVVLRAQLEHNAAPPPQGPRRGPPPAVEQYFQQLEAQNPEEVHRLRELRRTDPEAFRRELRERVQKRRGEREGDSPRERFPLKQHLGAIRSAETEEQREQAVADLRQKIAMRLEAGMTRRERAISEMRKKLEELESRHHAEMENKEQLINHHLQKALEMVE